MSERKDASRFDLISTSAAPTPPATEILAGQIEASTQISVRLPLSLVKALRVYLAQTETKQQDLIRRLLEEYLRERGAL
jgi:hypothetical protein